jgi:hypothetical protein
MIRPSTSWKEAFLDLSHDVDDDYPGFGVTLVRPGKTAMVPTLW